VTLSEEDVDCGGSEGDAYEDEISELEDLAGLSVDDILKKKTMRGIESLCKDLKLDYRKFRTGVQRSDEHVGEGNLVVRDPVVAKAKRSPKLAKKKALGKRRRCTGCKGTGNTKRNCPEKDEKRQQPDLRDHAFEGDGVFRPDRVDECGGFNATSLMSNDDWESIVGDNLCVKGKENAD
ncbi:hypothetical protein HN51_007010, partial [Arachis hypogaea]